MLDGPVAAYLGIFFCSPCADSAPDAGVAPVEANAWRFMVTKYSFCFSEGLTLPRRAGLDDILGVAFVRTVCKREPLKRVYMVVRFAFFFTSIALIGLSVGCGHKGSLGKKGLGGPIVVSRLSAEVVDPRSLLSMNSLVVQRPRYSSPSATTIPEEELLRVVREVAGQTLSMKLLPSSTSEAKADGLLQTEIVELRELRGSSVGGEPAAVAMKMTIARASDRRPIWQAMYVDRQQALSDNWLKVGQRIGRGGTGAGYVSAETLFRNGVTESLEDFNRRRDAQFQVEGVAGK